MVGKVLCYYLLLLLNMKVYAIMWNCVGERKKVFRGLEKEPYDVGVLIRFHVSL